MQKYATIAYSTSIGTLSRFAGLSHVVARHGDHERRSLLALLGSRRARLVAGTH